MVASCGPAHVFHKEAERGCPATGELAIGGQEDVAAVAGCTALASITIRTGAALDLGPLARLETIDGDLRIGPSVGLAEVALPRLRSVRGTIRIVGNGNLHAVLLPKLERADRIEIDGNIALANLGLPALVTTTGLAITHNADLEIVDVTALTALPALELSDNPKLVMIEGRPKAATVRVENNAALPAELADALR
ncbi:MAG: hypothetical protein ABI867_13530 [Kofleriaceae bacterium]